LWPRFAYLLYGRRIGRLAAQRPLPDEACPMSEFHPHVRSIFAAIALTAVPCAVHANDGDLDATFYLNGRDTYGIGTGPGGTSNDQVFAATIQPDGKIVLVGSSLGHAGDKNFQITRLTPDGHLDGAFNQGTQFATFNRGGNNDDVAEAVAIQPDGKIVVAGTVDGSVSGPGVGPGVGVARLMPDGSFDTTFGPDGSGTLFYGYNASGNVPIHVKDMALAADGSILVAGDITLTTSQEFYVQKFDSAGHAIVYNYVNFDLGGSNDDVATAIAVRPNGKILLGGYVARSAGGNVDCALAQFPADLSALDSGFGNAGKRTLAFDLGGNNADLCHAMALQPDGRILIGGGAAKDASGGTYATVARFLADGSALDSGFAAAGKFNTYFESTASGSINSVRAIAVQSDRRIVLAGYGTTPAANRAPFDFGVMRLLSNGALDSTFQGSTPGSNFGTTMIDFDGDDDRAFAGVLQGGRVIAAGQALAAPGIDVMAWTRLTSDLIFADGFSR
jgi:uncharacterized delta-60 repeat protein